jgi:hypothetical protein
MPFRITQAAFVSQLLELIMHAYFHLVLECMSFRLYVYKHLMYCWFQSTTELIAVQTDSLVQQHVEEVKKRVFEVLNRSNIEQEDLHLIDEIFEETDLPFDGLRSTYDRKKCIRNSYTTVVSAHVTCPDD